MFFEHLILAAGRFWSQNTSFCQQEKFALISRTSHFASSATALEHLSSRTPPLAAFGSQQETPKLKRLSLHLTKKKKRKVVRYQPQALSHLAHSVEQIALLQVKKHRLFIEADLKWGAMFLTHKKEETKRNRDNELRLAEIYTGAVSSQFGPQHAFNSTPPNIMSYLSSSGSSRFSLPSSPHGYAMTQGHSFSTSAFFNRTNSQ